MKHNAIKINNFNVSNDLPFFLIAGPCSIESKDHAIDHAGKINEICKQLNLNFVYKSSFDKANRSSSLSSRGVGIDQGLNILSDVKKTFNIPLITDVHESYQCKDVANVVDIIQIPAFLCRQTDLLYAAAETNKIIMTKKLINRRQAVIKVLLKARIKVRCAIWPTFDLLKKADKYITIRQTYFSVN